VPPDVRHLGHRRAPDHPHRGIALKSTLNMISDGAPS
jgi:hypothetical protein